MFRFWYDHPLFDEEEEPREEYPRRFVNVDRDDLWGQKDKQHAEPEAADTGNLTFRNYDRDDPWGRTGQPPAEPQPPASTDNLTFAQAWPAEPDSPPPTYRREIDLPRLDNPHRATADYRYEAYRFPADKDRGQPAPPTPEEEKAAFMGNLTGDYSPAQRERIADLWDERVGPPDQGAIIEVAAVEVAAVEVPEVVVPDWRIGLVVGYEETPTSGQIDLYYTPSEEEKQDNEEDDELT